MTAAAAKLYPETEGSTALLRAMLEGVDAGLAIVDDDGRVIASNERFFSMLQRSGLLLKKYAGKPQQALLSVPLSASAPELQDQPAEAKGPGGRLFHISYRADETVQGATMIQMRDVTGMAIDAGAVDSAREQAEMIQNARSAFVSQVAHHFRTPLHVILGYVDLLSEDSDASMSAADRSTYLQYIRESASALLLNMNEMMEVIRLQSEDVEAELEACDIGALLQSVADEAAETFEAENCRLMAEEACQSAAGMKSVIDPRLARRGIRALLNTCAVLGGQGSELLVSADQRENGQICLEVSFKTGRAKPEDVVASIKANEPVREISLTGQASGYGIVLAILLLRQCNAEVDAHTSDSEENGVVVRISFAHNSAG